MNNLIHPIHAQIEKYKLTISSVVSISTSFSAIDDKGHLLNLHGNNWSFTLAAEQLYQY